VRCRAGTVHLGARLRPLEIALNEKQIPQFVEKNRNQSRKLSVRLPLIAELMQQFRSPAKDETKSTQMALQ